MHLPPIILYAICRPRGGGGGRTVIGDGPVTPAMLEVLNAPRVVLI